MRLSSCILFALCTLCTLADPSSDDDKRKAVRMKTTRQLKEILGELSIGHAGLDKEALRELAFREDAIAKYEELHPEKKRKPRASGGSGGFNAPEGMDPLEWERLMAQMRGDFSSEKDPEKRRILEKLKKRGMSFGGGNDMCAQPRYSARPCPSGLMLLALPTKQGHRAAPQYGEDDGWPAEHGRHGWCWRRGPCG